MWQLMPNGLLVLSSLYGGSATVVAGTAVAGLPPGLSVHVSVDFPNADIAGGGTYVLIGGSG